MQTSLDHRPIHGAGDLPRRRPIVTVIGAGPLAHMLHRAAVPLDIELRVMPPDDADAIAASATDSAAVTFATDEVLDSVLDTLEARGIVTRPSFAATRCATDKRALRRALLDADVPVVPSIDARDEASLASALRIFGFPAVLKPARGDLTGRTVVVADGDDVTRATATLGHDLLVQPLLGEATLTVLVVRMRSGETRTYPVIRTAGRSGHRRLAVVPAALPGALEDDARVLAARAAAITGGVGVIAVQLQVVGDVVVVDDTVARPHPSGHITIDACATSQLENHLRAVLDWPLGPTDLVVGAAATLTVLAPATRTRPPEGIPDRLHVERLRVHLHECPGRREDVIAHVTALDHDRERAINAAFTAAALVEE